MELSSSKLPKWLFSPPSKLNQSAKRSVNLTLASTRIEHGTSTSKISLQSTKNHLVLMRHGGGHQGDRTGDLPNMEGYCYFYIPSCYIGESMWNDLNLFTGDVDIPLTEKGIMDALASGRAVSEIDFDIIFTSRLARAKQTALIAMTQNIFKRVPVIVRGGFHGRGKTGDANRLRLRDAAAKALKHASCHMVPVYADPALNERSYGDLQGLSKEAAIKEFGEETVKMWRRSYDTRPPHGESLKDTASRSVRFFKSTVIPRLEEHRNVLLVAHGNVLRCIIAHLAGLTEMEMLKLQVFTALPYAYTFDGGTFSEVCALPPLDPNTNSPREGIPLGISSVFKTGDINSLI